MIGICQRCKEPCEPEQVDGEWMSNCCNAPLWDVFGQEWEPDIFSEEVTDDGE